MLVLAFCTRATRLLPCFRDLAWTTGRARVYTSVTEFSRLARFAFFLFTGVLACDTRLTVLGARAAHFACVTIVTHGGSLRAGGTGPAISTSCRSCGGVPAWRAVITASSAFTHLPSVATVAPGRLNFAALSGIAVFALFLVDVSIRASRASRAGLLSFTRHLSVFTSITRIHTRSAILTPRTVFAFCSFVSIFSGCALIAIRRFLTTYFTGSAQVT